MVAELQSLDVKVILFFATSAVGLAAYISKGLFERPMSEAKTTFYRYSDKRIEILTEVKTRLNFIAYFPGKKESEPFKKQLQELLLKDGKVGYLNKSVYDAVLRISIDPITNETMLIDTIREIDSDLYDLVSKVRDETKFFRDFSFYNPFKRLLGLTILSVQYLFSMLTLALLVAFIVWGILNFGLVWKILLVILSIVLSWLGYKWQYFIKSN